jgi:hypothetical protein
VERGARRDDRPDIREKPKAEAPADDGATGDGGHQ